MDNNDQKSLKQIIDYRIKKINELRSNGIEPFPYKFKKDYNISIALQSEDNLKVSIYSEEFDNLVKNLII